MLGRAENVMPGVSVFTLFEDGSFAIYESRFVGSDVGGYQQPRIMFCTAQCALLRSHQQGHLPADGRPAIGVSCPSGGTASVEPE